MTRPVLLVLFGLLCLVGLIGVGLVKDRSKLHTILAPRSNRSKRLTEIWFLSYSFVWIPCFAYIVASGCYESFTAWTYFWVCGSLALPLYLQPFLFPALTGEEDLPLSQRHSLRANAWLAIFGFAGNYWYTHYFYNVLDARYTMPSYRLNDVPIPMFFATHFYFCFYHVISNCMLRHIDSFRATAHRFFFKIAAVAALAYFTAFMETLTISGFPYWEFEDRDRAYQVGSAFYGIYFIVSFPMFYQLDELPPNVVKKQRTPFVTVLKDALAASFVVLCLLDFARLFLRRPLNVYLSPFHTLN